MIQYRIITVEKETIPKYQEIFCVLIFLTFEIQEQISIPREFRGFENNDTLNIVGTNFASIIWIARIPVQRLKYTIFNSI